MKIGTFLAFAMMVVALNKTAPAYAEDKTALDAKIALVPLTPQYELSDDTYKAIEKIYQDFLAELPKALTKRFAPTDKSTNLSLEMQLYPLPYSATQYRLEATLKYSASQLKLPRMAFDLQTDGKLQAQRLAETVCIKVQTLLDEKNLSRR